MSIDLRECLRHIDPASLYYKEWCDVGMALKHEGYSPDDWEQWSARDAARFHPGECRKKWETFREESGEIITGGTLVQMAKARGWEPPMNGRALDWGDAISYSGAKPVIDRNWLEGQDVPQPSDSEWDQVGDIIRYLETLFQPNEYDNNKLFYTFVCEFFCFFKKT